VSKALESESLAPRPWVLYLGSAGLFGFAAFSFLGIGGANIGIGCMLLASVFDWRRFWGALRGDPAWWLMLWCLAAVGLSAGLRAYHYPAEASEQLDGFLKVAQLFLFLWVGWWLRGQQRLILWVLSLALVSFSLAVLRALDPESLAGLIAWQRTHFLWSINAVGQYAAACLFGMVMLTPRFWKAWAGRRGAWPLRTVWFALMSLVAGLVVLSLSRGVWLSLAMVAVCTLFYLAWAHRGNHAIGRRLLLVATVAVLMISLTLSASDAVRSRVAIIVQPIVELWTLEGDVGRMSEESGRIRARLVMLGIDTWLSSPWLGAGPHAPKRIIREHREEFRDWETYSDFHNLVVDMLASYGVLGSLPLLLTFMLVLRAAHRGYRSGWLDRDLYLTLLGLLLLNALAQLTDTRILASHGRFYSMLFAGAAYSGWLAARLPGGAVNPSARR
jgi:O-antigen ligase